MQEFFTALYVANNSQEETYLIENLDSIFWRDVPIYLIGIIENPLIFIDKLLEHNYILLASECLIASRYDDHEYRTISEKANEP